MSNSVRYFQLTPDILLEYDYTTTGIITEKSERGDVSDRVIDLNGHDKVTVIGNEYDSSTYFYVNDDDNGIYASKRNFVIPINKSHTKFIKYNRYDKFESYGNEYIKYNSNSFKLKPYFVDDESDNGVIDVYSDFDVVFDKIKIHFTSRNFMGEYNGIIIQAYIYNNTKRKIELMSFLISRFDDLKLNPEPMLINQKLYTTYINAKIVSTECLLYNGIYSNSFGSNKLLSYLNDKNEKLVKNTPIIFDIFGIRNTYDIISHEGYTCEKINNISVPCRDSFDGVSVSIEEADDGDYFIIKPNVEGTGYKYMSDFIGSLTESPETFMILHELSLTEYYLSSSNELKSEITHVEHYIVNAAKERMNSDGNEYELNYDALDDDFLYRPICKHSGSCIKFTISDTLKIVDTINNTTIVKKSSYDCKTPYKYGKHLNKIYLGEIPSQVNVYNRRANIHDEDLEKVVFSSNTNVHSIKTSNGENSSSSGGLSINTQEIGITAFCESTNIRIITTDLLK